MVGLAVNPDLIVAFSAERAAADEEERERRAKAECLVITPATPTLISPAQGDSGGLVLGSSDADLANP